METKADVKAIMARFQASEATDENPCMPTGRPKQPLHPLLSSGPIIHAKKPIMDSLSGSPINVPPKPSFQKNTVPAKCDTEGHELNKTKTLVSKFSNAQDNTNGNDKPFTANKQQLPLKPLPPQAPEAKGPGQKPPPNKPSLTSTLSDSKSVFPKPSPAAIPKPSWVKEDTDRSETDSTRPKLPPLQNKPSSSLLKLRQQNEEMATSNTDIASKPFKPQSNFKIAQNMFNKEPDRTEQPENSVKAEGVSKPPLAATHSIPPPKPPASKKPSLKKASPQASSVNGETTSRPKRRPLPNMLALGPPPTKPNRPPIVNLETFKKGTEASDDGPATLKKPFIPAPLNSHLGNHINSLPPPQLPPLPILPPRHPGTTIQQEELYDDVDEFSSVPPPLPSSAGHPSQRSKTQEESDDDDGEMYEDLDEQWEAAEQKQDKAKGDKEEKKRLEAEKKEQKEREKKEQDARKKFKLVGPLETIHQGKACSDYRGSKTDLALKQGDSLDIIRVQGNPEGKWLGRTQDGSIGYVKTTSVEIDFNTLKKRKVQQTYEPEVYDDVDVPALDNSVNKGPGVVLPPPPGEDGEIYDDIVDPNLEVSASDPRFSPAKPRGFLRMFERSRRTLDAKVVPPPSQFSAEASSDQPREPIDEEIYDDVDSQPLPPPPPLSSLPPLKCRSRAEEMEPKKQKKMEKEEKEFRKKFKYDGEIQVLYQVTITPTLTNKKWASKELSVKAGEKLDVIANAADNKLICRNEEGKFGYVSTCHIMLDDGDIYDDIGDDCIYDND